jgi:hypothetical protein
MDGLDGLRESISMVKVHGRQPNEKDATPTNPFSNNTAMIAKFILGGHTILSDTSTSTLDDLDDNIQVDVQVPGTFYS